MADPLRSTLLLPAALLFAAAAAAAVSSAADCSQVTFAGNRTYATCADLPYLSASLHWTYRPADGTADIAYRAAAPAEQWSAWAINPTGRLMPGCNAFFAFHDAATTAVSVITVVLPNHTPAIRNMSLSFPVSDLAADYADGAYSIYATVTLPGNNTAPNLVWQAGGQFANGLPSGQHQYVDTPVTTLQLLTNDSVVLPAPPSNTVVVNPLLQRKNIHGVLNAVSWGFLLPLGVVLARYMRVFPSLDPAWFNLHITCQLSGYALGVTGWALGLQLSDDTGGGYSDHRTIGIVLFCFATLQVLALLLRPRKDHSLRFYWNLYHWGVGYAVVILGIVNVFKGLDILQPAGVYRQAYVAVLIALAAVAFVLEIFTDIVRVRQHKSAPASANGYHY